MKDAEKKFEERKNSLIKKAADVLELDQGAYQNEVILHTLVDQIITDYETAFRTGPTEYKGYTSIDTFRRVREVQTPKKPG